MNDTGKRELHAFSIWLRTGRQPVVEDAHNVELKFNPWHDPENGRFTFANTGRFFGRGWRSGSATGSGGGRFGGGGATGTWQNPRSSTQARKTKPSSQRQVISRSTRSESGETAQPEQFRRVVRNGYEYHIDARGRTRRVEGNLMPAENPARSRTSQAKAGGSDRRSSDDGGHYIAARFNGPAEAFNHFAQDSNFNRGRYRALEDEWARAIRTGKKVIVKIVPYYEDRSSRPYEIDAWFTIDGYGKSLKFPNGRKG